jgi:Co/Zn/Cd efflux system component
MGGMFWGLAWLDPLMGLVGAALVSAWAWGLLRQSGKILLDAEMDAPVVAEVREAIERGAVPATITDLHVWRVGRGKYAVMVSVTTPSSEGADFFRRALSVHEELAHVTVEVTRS